MRLKGGGGNLLCARHCENGGKGEGLDACSKGGLRQDGVKKLPVPVVNGKGRGRGSVVRVEREKSSIVGGVT